MQYSCQQCLFYVQSSKKPTDDESTDMYVFKFFHILCINQVYLHSIFSSYLFIKNKEKRDMVSLLTSRGYYEPERLRHGRQVFRGSCPRILAEKWKGLAEIRTVVIIFHISSRIFK